MKLRECLNLVIIKVDIISLFVLVSTWYSIYTYFVCKDKKLVHFLVQAFAFQR